MYSEIFLLEIKNPESKHMEKYVVDYSGNKSEDEVKTEIAKYIKKHKSFCGHAFSIQCAEGIDVTYLPNLVKLDLTIDREIWDIDKLYL